MNKPTIEQIFAWTAWVAFLLFSVAGCLFGMAEKHDPYFVRHYEHNPIDHLTVFMTSYSMWMAVPPLLWLPFVLAYQRQDHPKWMTLLFLSFPMFVMGVVEVVLFCCSGPPIQM